MWSYAEFLQHTLKAVTATELWLKMSPLMTLTAESVISNTYYNRNFLCKLYTALKVVVVLGHWLIVSKLKISMAEWAKYDIQQKCEQLC